MGWILFAVWLIAVSICIVCSVPAMYGNMSADNPKVIEIPQGSCNICLGVRAGEDITNQSLQFRFTIPVLEDTIVKWSESGYWFETKKTVKTYCEYYATMTPAEYEALFALTHRMQFRYLPEKEPNQPAFKSW